MKLTLIFILNLGQVKNNLYINENTTFSIMMNVYRHFKDKILNPIKSTINSTTINKAIIKTDRNNLFGNFYKLKIKFLT